MITDHVIINLYYIILRLFSKFWYKTMDRERDNNSIRTSGSLDYDAKPWRQALLRVWFAITLLAVLIAFILGLVKAKDDAVMYLLVTNLLVSGIIGATIAWWFHTGHIKEKSLVFILFVGMCIVFQAIVSDIYLYHGPNSPHNAEKLVNSSTISPSTAHKVLTGMTKAIYAQ